MTNCTAQPAEWLSCAEKLDTNARSESIEIYIYGDPRCGYCHKALKEISRWAKGKSIHIIAMDLTGKPKSVQKLKLYSQNDIEVRDASVCGDEVKNFIPKIFVREKETSKEIVRFRGWKNKKLKRLEKKLKKYI